MKAASAWFRPGSWLGEWPSEKILLGCLVGAKILIHLALTIYVCRHSVIPLPNLWPALRHFD